MLKKKATKTSKEIILETSLFLQTGGKISEIKSGVTGVIKLSKLKSNADTKLQRKKDYEQRTKIDA